MAQGTIKDWDEETRTGSLLMEDRTEVGIDSTSIEGSNMRTLRLDQRARFDLTQADSGPIARTLTLVTFD